MTAYEVLDGQMEDELIEKQLESLFSDATLTLFETQGRAPNRKRHTWPGWMTKALGLLLSCVVLAFALSGMGRRARPLSTASPPTSVANTITDVSPATLTPTAGVSLPKVTVVVKHARQVVSKRSLASSMPNQSTPEGPVATVVQPSPTPTNTGTPTSTPSIQPPEAPSNLQATPLDATHLRLDWSDNSEDESGFGICDGDMCVATTEADVTSYTVGGLEPDSYHCYHVYAFNDGGDSPWTDWVCDTTPPRATSPANTPAPTLTPVKTATPTSTPSAQPPEAPSDLQATPLDATHIRLDWSDNSERESGFGICDGDICIAATEADATSYTVGGLTPGSYRCLRVYAFNEYGNSPWTDWACATTPLPTPTPTK